MSQRILTVNGATEADLEKRYKAIEALNGQETVVLERLTMLSASPKAKSYLSNNLLFIGVKKFFGI